MRQFCFLSIFSLSLAGLGFGQNNPPTVQSQTAAMYENTTLIIEAPGVLTNATDPDNDPFTAVLLSSTNGFTVIVQTNGAYSYTPPAGFIGTNCFTFAATDGTLTSTPATVCVVVDGPTGYVDNYSIPENSTLIVPAPGVLTNDTSTLPSPLAAHLVDPPEHGSLDLQPDGSFTYVPDLGYNSGSFFILPDSFQYQATDGFATSSPTRVFINVTPVVGASDANLQIASLKFKQIRNAASRDSLTIAGRLNPRGAHTDLTGAAFALDVNGHALGVPAFLDAAGKGSSLSASGVFVQARFNSLTGQYTAKIRGLDLTFFDLVDTTGLGVTALAATIKIHDAGLDLPEVSATIVPRYATLAGKYTRGLFLYKLYETYTGVFASLKSTAKEVNGNFQVSLTGLLEPEGAVVNQPIGDIRITIGTHVINVSSNLVAGKTDFVVKKGQVVDVTKFAISSQRRNFTLSTQPIPNTGIPLANVSTNLVYKLPLLLEIPMDSATNYYETFIELKRPDSRSTKWSR